MTFCVTFRYDDVTIGKNGKFNSGFWGQECGPEHDYTPQRWHKYMEDAISVNTGRLFLLCAQLHLTLNIFSMASPDADCCVYKQT